LHDAGYYDLPFKEGVVVTVEPGIYIPEEDIGIRIEDVVLVTKDGPKVLSRHIPRTIKEIEAALYSTIFLVESLSPFLNSEPRAVTSIMDWLSAAAPSRKKPRAKIPELLYC